MQALEGIPVRLNHGRVEWLQMVLGGSLADWWEREGLLLVAGCWLLVALLGGVGAVEKFSPSNCGSGLEQQAGQTLIATHGRARSKQATNGTSSEQDGRLTCTRRVHGSRAWPSGRRKCDQSHQSVNLLVHLAIHMAFNTCFALRVQSVEHIESMPSPQPLFQATPTLCRLQCHQGSEAGVCTRSAHLAIYMQRELASSIRLTPDNHQKGQAALYPSRRPWVFGLGPVSKLRGSVIEPPQSPLVCRIAGDGGIRDRRASLTQQA